MSRSFVGRFVASALLLTVIDGSEAQSQRGRLPHSVGNLSLPIVGGDSHGRPVDSHGHLVDSHGHHVNQQGQHTGNRGVPGHFHGGGNRGGYPSYGYGGYPVYGYGGQPVYGGYHPNYGTTYGIRGYGVDGYSGYNAGYGPAGAYSGYGYSGYGGYAAPVVNAPVIVSPQPAYGTATTIIRGGPSGGVVEYSHNGNGYTYTPGSSYPTVIRQSPTFGPSGTTVIDGPPPVVLESRPSPNVYQPQQPSLPNLSLSRSKSKGVIKLGCPKASSSGLKYTLNGHPYTIQPGYSQSFEEDREWTIEFARTGDKANKAVYSLKAGTYLFVEGPNGWDLQQPGGTSAPSIDLPPPPIPPAPEPMP